MASFMRLSYSPSVSVPTGWTEQYERKLTWLVMSRQFGTFASRASRISSITSSRRRIRCGYKGQ